MSRYFTDQHEWIEVDGHSATIGISEHAQHLLGDIVFVDLPAVGTQTLKGQGVAVVESVKAASDVYSPVAGKVTQTNAALEGDPALVNTAPESDGWFFKLTLSNPDELEGLMDANAYGAWVKSL